MGIPQHRGSHAEALAASYLELTGCTIEARNIRVAGVELDLVVNDGKALVVVEVKCRTRPDYGGAAGAIDRTKLDRLRRAAITLERHGRPVRVDVVTLDLDPGGATLRHYRNVVTD